MVQTNTRNEMVGFSALVIAACTLWEVERMGCNSPLSTKSITAKAVPVSPPDDDDDRSTMSLSTTSSDCKQNEDSDYEELELPPATTGRGKYWMEPTWIPRDSSGNIIPPMLLRRKLNKLIESQKFSPKTIYRALGVNPNSFRNFTVQDYSRPWMAVANGTYWAAARMFESMRFDSVLDITPGAFSVELAPIVQDSMEDLRAEIRDSLNNNKAPVSVLISPEPRSSTHSKKTPVKKTPAKRGRPRKVQVKPLSGVQIYSDKHPISVARGLKTIQAKLGFSSLKLADVALEIDVDVLDKFMATPTKKSAAYRRGLNFLKSYHYFTRGS